MSKKKEVTQELLEKLKAAETLEEAGKVLGLQPEEQEKMPLPGRSGRRRGRP